MPKLAPPSALAPYVELIQVVETRECESMTRVLVPNGRVLLTFRYRGFAELLQPARTRIPNAALTGVHASARVMHTSAQSGMILFAFRPGAASAFFPQALHELFGAHVPLELLAPKHEVEATHERVILASTHAQRSAAVSEFLLAQRKAMSHALDVDVQAAVTAIASDPSGVRIGELAESLGLARDTLEKRFRRSVGASPKQWASIVRLRAAVEAFTPGHSLARLALDAGYFDQSHFVRELRASTGTAPQRFFREATWC